MQIHKQTDSRQSQPTHARTQFLNQRCVSSGLLVFTTKPGNDKKKSHFIPTCCFSVHVGAYSTCTCVCACGEEASTYKLWRAKENMYWGGMDRWGETLVFLPYFPSSLLKAIVWTICHPACNGSPSEAWDTHTHQWPPSPHQKRCLVALA